MVTAKRESAVHIWLINDEGGGVQFMADIVRMLQAIAQREGISISVVDSPVPSLAASEHVFVQFAADSAPVVVDQAGVHRAQLVPPDSKTGRIATSLVGVELLHSGAPPSLGRPEGPVLKTYNYVLRRVTQHSTGAVSPLDTVLSGQA